MGAGNQIDDGLTALENGDFAAALQVMRPLAQQGDADAQYCLGAMYANGQGVSRDDAEAARWLRLAAGQGVAEAQYNLGFMYANGQGVPRDDEEALKWYRESAAQGTAEAQYNLGFMYANGQGIPQDLVRAHLCFSLAVAGGLETAVPNRDLVAGRMTPPQIAEAQQLAGEWSLNRKVGL